MFTKTSVKKTAILFVALLLCLTLVFAACNSKNSFKPVAMPTGTGIDSNGGAAVRYGDYIYYVNGSQSSATAENTYTEGIRTGSVVRIKVADLEDVIKINDDDKTSALKTSAIREAINKKAETVVPNYYFTGNKTTTDLNGIFIFNDRIYITTPNNESDVNGNVLNDQLVLASYKLDGSDMQRHYVFASNAPQLKLSQVGSDVYATFVLDNALNSLKVGDKDATVIAKSTKSVNFSGDYVYYQDDDGSICQYKVGDAEAKILVKNEVQEGHEGHSHGISYTIKYVNQGYVYYTQSDSSSQTSDLQLYYASAEGTGIIMNAIPSSSYYGYEKSVIYTASVKEDITMYGIWKATLNSDGEIVSETVLDPAQNSSAITFNKIDGSKLYYTTNSVSYVLDLSVADAKPVAYAYNLSFSATDWALPDVVSFEYNDKNVSYVFSVGSASVSVVKFNPDKKNNNLPNSVNSSSSTITLVEIEEK